MAQTGRGNRRNKPIAQKTPAEKEALKERVRSMKMALDKPKLIGSEEELIPFSWRYPLSAPDDSRKMSKVYKEVIATEKSLTFRNS